jgi:hypothetical protein
MTYGGGDVRSTMSRMGATQSVLPVLRSTPLICAGSSTTPVSVLRSKGPIWKTSSVPVTKNGA